MDEFVKITVGFVHQAFAKNAEGKFLCIEQAFIAGDECEYEDLNGNPLEAAPEYAYQPYNMILGETGEQNVKYLLYNDVLGSLENEEPIEAASLEEALSQALRNMGYSIIEAEKDEKE